MESLNGARREAPVRSLRPALPARDPRGLAVVALLATAGCYRHAVTPSDSPPPSALGELVSIPGGSFTMGDVNGDPSEYPERPVRIDAFSLDRTEVTNAAYSACVGAGRCEASPYREDPVLGRPEHPVVGVSWFDAEAFCRFVGRRLPTEAEWEYAARGPDLRLWPWAGAFDPSKANTREKSSFPRTAPVGRFVDGASPFGVLDMAGNAAEWTADFFDPTWYRTQGAAVNPTGPNDGRERVVRGGSWADGSHRVRVAARVAKAPTEVDDATGFRCAR